MCGILLYLGKEKLSASHQSLSSIVHRGPDASGMVSFQVQENMLSLGHRRLSIIDLSSAANQPMQDATGSCWMTFNGEIYNYIELRETLKKLGKEFVTNSDTEVLLNAYVQWGVDCLQKLNGMFSFCIWDSRDNSIFIARDRYGIKPLYFWNSQKGFSVVSEIKQLTYLSYFKSKVNLNAATLYLYANDFNSGEDTIWDGVFEIEPGNFVKLDLAHWRPGDPLTQKRWYKLEDCFHTGRRALSLKDSLEEFEFLLEDSIRLRMRSDVEVGTLLSGGLDSSSITHLASRMRNESKPISAFTAVYSEFESEELSGLDQLNSRLIKKNEIKVAPENLSQFFETVAYSYDIPNAGGSTLSYYALYQDISARNIKVTLEGQGADEGFSGYSNFSLSNMCELLKGFHFCHLIKSAKHHLSEYPSIGISRLLLTILQYQFSQYTFRRAIGNDLNRSSSGIINFNQISTDYLYSSKICRAANNVRDMHLLKMKVLRQILHTVDRSSMAYSVESRSPFLDHRLLEFGLSLPTAYKIQDGYRKYILRKMMDGNLPKAINWRRGKTGFTSPESKWVKNEFQMYMLSKFKLLQDCPIIHYGNLMKKFNLYLAGKTPYDKTFWRIASFSQWLETFKLSI